MNVRDFFVYCRRSRVVRVAVIYVPIAWFSLRAILIAIPGLDAPDWVPRVFGVLVLIGYPIALIVSWALDVEDSEESGNASPDVVIVPGGTKRTQRKQTSTAVFGTLLFVGMLALGAAIYVTLNPILSTAEKLEENIGSIAVLPFLNLSADAGQRFFCDGLSEELLNLLTGVESLQVAARTSSFAMRESGLDIPSIAKKLRVSHVLEGSVRRDGDQLRVTAQLVRASDGYHLWSENYEREFTQIFEIQDDIATSIVAHLVTSLNGKSAFDQLPDVERTSPEAYFAYLKGRGVLTYPGRENLLQAAQQFDVALSISPTYEPALIGQLYTQTLIGLSDGQPIAERRALFAKALHFFEMGQRDAWVAASASALGLSLYEWERTKDVLELGLGVHLREVSLSMLNTELLLILDDEDNAAFELNRMEDFAPGIAAATYLRALIDYDSSEAALEELFVLSENARSWDTSSLPESVRDARRQLFRNCRTAILAADDALIDASECGRLRSFSVPLLAMHGQEARASKALVAMTQKRAFDATLARLPSVSALLDRPDAMIAREILALPGSAPGPNLAVTAP
jgi:TolB-like protein